MNGPFAFPRSEAACHSWLMDRRSLDHQLTDEEATTFERDGYLIIPDAVPENLLDRLVGSVDRIHQRAVASGIVSPTDRLHFPDFLREDAAFLDLIDYQVTFPKIWGILGWNIYLYHAHLAVSPPTGVNPVRETLKWHQDSARVNADIETSPRPRLSTKVGFFLSDVSEAGRGNFWIIPGSHLTDTVYLPDDPTAQPAGAIPVCVKPGTAVFFDRRLWHAASPNWSDVTRKVLFYGYAYRWLRTKDDMTGVADLWGSADPIRRQLLGHSTNAEGHYRPTDEDAPLSAWLRSHGTRYAGGPDVKPGHATRRSLDRVS